MDEELISEKRYADISRRAYWKNSVRRYQEEQSLEDAFMDEEEFTRLEHIVKSGEGVLDAIQALASHGIIRIPVHMNFRKIYFKSKDALVEAGVLTNTRAPKLSDKGRAFLLEYGRRKYDSND